MLLISSAYAQEAVTTATNAAAAAPGAGSMIANLAPLALIFVVFYFLLIRPQQRKMKEHQSMLEAVRRGDKIMTGGGIYGTVVKVDADDVLHVEIAPNVKIRVAKGTIATVINRSGDADTDASVPAAPPAKVANDN